MFKRRSALAPAAIAVVAIVIIVIAGVGAYALLGTHSTTSSSTTSSSTTSSTSTKTTVAPTGCIFAPPSVLQAPSNANLDFTGCLKAGASGTYLISATDPDGLNMTGTITATYPIQITIGSAKVGSLLTAAGVIYTKNDTTSADIFNLTLFPSNGYGITILNEGGQNNTVTMNLQISDIPGGGD